MKTLKFSPNLALLVIITFLTTMSFGPVLTSCGSSGGGSATSSGSDSSGTTNTTHLAYSSPKTTTTDDSGTATVSSSNINKEFQLTIKNSAGQEVSGLNIEYADTAGGEIGHLIISDPNEIYQSAIIMFDSDDLSEASTSNVVAMSADGTLLPRAITITVAIIYIVLTVLTAKAVYEIGTGLYELYGDPPTVSVLGSYVYACISTNQILTMMNIGINAIGLITAGSMSAAATGAAAGTKTAWEAYGKDLAVDGATTVGTKFAEYLSDEAGFDPAKKYCTLLVASASQSTRYESAADLIVQECSTASECGSDSTYSETSGTIVISGATTGSGTYTGEIDMGALDWDGDGYSYNDGDCDNLNSNVYPGFLEICGDGIDQNCSGADMECSGDLVVDITSPPKTANCPEDMLINGICGGDTRGLTVMAQVTGGDDNSAYIIVNGRIVQAELDDNGIVSSNNPALLKCQSDGWINKIQVVAVDKYSQTAMDEMEWVCNGGATDMLIMLTWDTCDTDLDLYVEEPSGDIRVNNGDWVAGSETSSAGVVYGYETNCYGPVYYAILEGAPVGFYRIHFHHNSGSQTPTATVRIITDESHDDPRTLTYTLDASNSAVSGTANFDSTDLSWRTTIPLLKVPNGYWMYAISPLRGLWNLTTP